MTDSDAIPTGGDGKRSCDWTGCDDDAVAVYEGCKPPAGTVVFASCNDHAPDVQPIRWIGDRLVTDGGRPRDGDDRSSGGVKQ